MFQIDVTIEILVSGNADMRWDFRIGCKKVQNKYFLIQIFLKSFLFLL